MILEVSKIELEKKNEELIKEASGKFSNHEASKLELEKKNEILLNEIEILKISSRSTSSLNKENEKPHLDLKDLNERSNI